MSVFLGDYLGFTLGNIHSSQLNITRVTNGNRYSENLTPNFTDGTAAVPGGDGTYYWSTVHNQKPFSIDFAFDDLREEDIRRLKQIFSFKGVQPLIFDEYSYKKYYVKCSSPPVLKFIPFSDLGDVLNYKGEGSVNLVAFYPYAESVRVGEVKSGTTDTISNIGDLEMPIKIYYASNRTSINVSLTDEEGNTSRLVMSGISKLSNADAYIGIDMKTHLVEGVKSNLEKTGNLYNRFITSGDFFNVPVGLNTLNSNVAWSKVTFNYLYY